jgi:hypothetical protein
MNAIQRRHDLAVPPPTAWSANVTRSKTVGIVSGRGSGRDQLGRGNAAPGLGYVADSQIVLGFPVRSQAWLGTGRFPNLLAGFENRGGRF